MLLGQGRCLGLLLGLSHERLHRRVVRVFLEHFLADLKRRIDLALGKQLPDLIELLLILLRLTLQTFAFGGIRLRLVSKLTHPQLQILLVLHVDVAQSLFRSGLRVQ